MQSSVDGQRATTLKQKNLALAKENESDSKHNFLRSITKAESSINMLATQSKLGSEDGAKVSRNRTRSTLKTAKTQTNLI